MRLVHLSDLHLGFRQYQRLTPRGINQREEDVARTFQAAIDRIIALKPGLVVVGGDVFHSVRPTNPAILHAFLQFSRLRTALPETVVVLIGGNHDTPRAAETGSILRLFGELGIHVAANDTRHLSFPEHDLAVLAVPDSARERPMLRPGGEARYNVLVIHGSVEGVVPAHLAAVDRANIMLEPADLRAKEWSYVALGHYHVYREVAPNAFYSGSIDYTSVNPWGELHEQEEAHVPGKGFIEHDLESGAHHFHALPASRELVELPTIFARGLSSAEVDEKIAALVDRHRGGIDDKVVRLMVRDIPRHISRELDRKALREYKRRALNFHLDTRRPELVRSSLSGSPGRRPSLADVVREKLSSRMLESDVDREALVELGLRYLREAEATATAPGDATLFEGGA